MLEEGLPRWSRGLDEVTGLLIKFVSSVQRLSVRSASPAKSLSPSLLAVLESIPPRTSVNSGSRFRNRSLRGVKPGLSGAGSSPGVPVPPEPLGEVEGESQLEGPQSVEKRAILHGATENNEGGEGAEGVACH